MKNERGGIISKLFIIPIGVALMVGFFFLGYYVGKYQTKSGMQGEVSPPLNEIGLKNSSKLEEFTFYKTLSDTGNKTVSFDLKPGPGKEESRTNNKKIAAEAPKASIAQPMQKEKRIEIVKKDTAIPAHAKKESSAPASSNGKLRYTIQVAAYQDKEMAENVVTKLKKRGYAAFIASSELPGKGLWHRVKVGSFSNKAAAEKLQKELHAKAGVSPIVVIE